MPPLCQPQIFIQFHRIFLGRRREMAVPGGVSILFCIAAQRVTPRGPPMLEMQNFLIKEQVAFLQTADIYDIFDPETGRQVGQAKEVIGTFASLMRLIIGKKLMSTTVEVREHPEGALVFVIKKPVAFFRSVVE